ncbi:helix-turn-helix transcriptional regulator [bacterium]|nr:helix-turn-helix transcriptional regulator [bacterium]
MNRSLDERLARMRAHLHSAMLDCGHSVGQLASTLGLASAEQLSAYISGREPMPVWVLLRLAEITGKPLWWFFDEPPQGITLESAQIALQNISRVRLYLEALETEFQLVTAKHKNEPTFTSYEPSMEVQPLPRSGGGGQVVDFSKYLNRARAILSRETDSEESEVSQESVEMVAQGLLSAETGCAVTDMVERLRRRNRGSLEESVEI